MMMEEAFIKVLKLLQGLIKKKEIRGMINKSGFEVIPCK